MHFQTYKEDFSVGKQRYGSSKYYWLQRFLKNNKLNRNPLTNEAMVAASIVGSEISGKNNKLNRNPFYFLIRVMSLKYHHRRDPISRFVLYISCYSTHLGLINSDNRTSEISQHCRGMAKGKEINAKCCILFL